MNTDLDIAELLDYIDQSLPDKRRIEIDFLILSDSSYLRVLNGLILLLKELKSKEEVIAHLNQRKNRLANELGFDE